jgi:hypothetical protein
VTAPALDTTGDDDDAAWEAFFASPYFQALVAQALADIEAGRTMPMPETDEEWEAFMRPEEP